MSVVYTVTNVIYCKTWRSFRKDTAFSDPNMIHWFGLGWYKVHKRGYIYSELLNNDFGNCIACCICPYTIKVVRNQWALRCVPQRVDRRTGPRTRLGRSCGCGAARWAGWIAQVSWTDAQRTSTYRVYSDTLVCTAQMHNCHQLNPAGSLRLEDELHHTFREKKTKPQKWQNF